MQNFTIQRAELHNTVCRTSQHSVQNFTTQRAELHNTMCRTSQHSVQNFTTQRAELHNTMCRTSQHSVQNFTTQCAELQRASLDFRLPPIFYIRAALFCEFTQRRVAVFYRRCGTTYRSRKVGKQLPFRVA